MKQVEEADWTKLIILTSAHTACVKRGGQDRTKLLRCCRNFSYRGGPGATYNFRLIPTLCLADPSNFRNVFPRCARDEYFRAKPRKTGKRTTLSRSLASFLSRLYTFQPLFFFSSSPFFCLFRRRGLQKDEKEKKSNEHGAMELNSFILSVETATHQDLIFLSFIPVVEE